MNIYELIYEKVKTIPKGKVATYGQIASMCGNYRLSRVVGYALHKNPAFGEIPCHRVVNRFGKVAESFAFGGGDVQAQMLNDEGVEVKDGKVDLNKYQM